MTLCARVACVATYNVVFLSQRPREEAVVAVVEREAPLAAVEVGMSCFGEPVCLLLSSETPSRRLLKNHPFPLMGP